MPSKKDIAVVCAIGIDTGKNSRLRALSAYDCLSANAENVGARDELTFAAQ